MKALRVHLLAAAIVAALAAPAAAEVLSTWDTVIAGTPRFRLLPGFANAAAVDRETGLVWERSPDSVPRTWLSAHRFCNDRSVGAGNRLGWRLPTLQELASLVDPTVAARPALPTGHPFTNVQADFYWSATTFGENPANVWGVSFVDGPLTDPGARFTGKTATFYTWCVRTGHGGPDTQ